LFHGALERGLRFGHGDIPEKEAELERVAALVRSALGH
jgi:hypothetical protein